MFDTNKVHLRRYVIKFCNKIETVVEIIDCMWNSNNEILLKLSCYRNLPGGNLSPITVSIHC